MIKFYEDSSTIDTDYRADLKEGIRTVDELLNELSIILKFPDYFGFNWNALSDCLRDLSWINAKNISLIHRDIPDIDFENKKVYIQVLVNAIDDWEADSEHHLNVYFSESEKEIIWKLIS